LPWGTGGSAQALRYRERIDPEWYAYEILEAYSGICKVIIRGEAVILNRVDGLQVIWPALEMAYRLGNLATEAQELGYYRETGATGGKRKRRILPVGELIRHLIGKTKKGTARELWTMVPRNQDDGIKIKGHKFFRKGDLLLAIRKGDDANWRRVGKPLKLDAFRKRVKEARKPSAR
jgi:hypothetical protein